MKPICKETFLLWSETSEYKMAVSKANQIIAQALDRFNKPVIAFSGGKDSLAMMYMVLKQSPDTMVFHWDFGPYYLPRYIEDEIIGIIKSTGTGKIVVDTSPLYLKMKRNKKVIFFNHLFGITIPRFKRLGYDCEFIGLREQESLKRKRKIDNRWLHTEFQMVELYPLYKLSWKDVWAYIVSNNLPYLSHYDRYAELVGYEQMRFSTFFDSEFETLGLSNIDGLLMTDFKNIK